MDNNTNKEKWISEAFDSTRGMNRAAPGDAFFTGIMSKLETGKTAAVIQLPVKQWAAAAVILLALNIGSVVYFANRGKQAGGTAAGNPLASEMQLETSYNY